MDLARVLLTAGDARGGQEDDDIRIPRKRLDSMIFSIRSNRALLRFSGATLVRNGTSPLYLTVPGKFPVATPHLRGFLLARVGLAVRNKHEQRKTLP